MYRVLVHEEMTLEALITNIQVVLNQRAQYLKWRIVQYELQENKHFLYKFGRKICFNGIYALIRGVQRAAKGMKIISRIPHVLVHLIIINLAVISAYFTYRAIWKKRSISTTEYLKFNAALIINFIKHTGRTKYFFVPVPVSDPIFVPWFSTFESLMRCVWLEGKVPNTLQRLLGLPKYLTIYYAYFLCTYDITLQKDCFKLLLKKSPSYRFAGYLGLADLEHLLANWHQEIHWYHVRELYFDTDAVFGYSLSDPISRLDRYSYDRVLKYYRKALAIYPDHFFVLEQMGLAYKNKGDYRSSLANFTASVEANPANSTARIRRTQMRAMLESSQETLQAARDEYKQVFARADFAKYWQTPIVAAIASVKSVCGQTNMPYMTTSNEEQLRYNYRIFHRGNGRNHTVNLAFAEGYIAELEDTVDLAYGLMLSKGRYLLEDTKHLASPHLKLFADSLHETLHDRAFIMLSGSQHVDIKQAIILAGFYPNYHHFLIDCLGSLANFEHTHSYDHLPILFSGQLTRWQGELLNLLGVDAERIIQRGETRPYHVDTLVFPSLLSRFNVSHPAAVRFLRKKLVKNDLKVRPGKRVFITRRNIRGRKIANEEALISMVKRYGVEIINTAGWTVAQQVEYFSDVELIIAPGGAALANLLFCPQDTKVIILSSDRSWVETFTTITGLLGMKAWVCIGVSSVPPMPYYLWTSFDSTPVESEVELCIQEALSGAPEAKNIRLI